MGGIDVRTAYLALESLAKGGVERKANHRTRAKHPRAQCLKCKMLLLVFSSPPVLLDQRTNNLFWQPAFGILYTSEHAKFRLGTTCSTPFRLTCLAHLTRSLISKIRGSERSTALDYSNPSPIAPRFFHVRTPVSLRFEPKNDDA